MAQIDNTINVNSSWSITESLSVLDSLKLQVWVYSGTQGNSASASVALGASGSRATTPTYTLNSTAVLNGTNKEVSFEISTLVKDFIESELNGQFNSDNTVWVDIQTTSTINSVEVINASQHYLAVDGYEYTRNDGVEDGDKVLRISNRDVLKLSGHAVRIPVLRQKMVDFAFEKDGVLIYSGTTSDFSDSSLSNEQTSYISNSSSNIDSFKQRVLSDGPSRFENNPCLIEFENEFETFNADRLLISYDYSGDPLVSSNPVEIINFTNVDECRYEPRRLTFVNKFGAFEDIWFFKNSKRTLDVKSDTWNRRNLITGGGAYRPTTVKNTTQVNEKIVLNSGFYPEASNVSFEELIQSNSVWIWDEINTHPILIKDTSFNFKDSNTDKLINYTLTIEYASNKMKTL